MALVDRVVGNSPRKDASSPSSSLSLSPSSSSPSRSVPDVSDDLFQICRAGSARAVFLLLKEGADPLLRTNTDGSIRASPFVVACGAGNADAVCQMISFIGAPGAVTAKRRAEIASALWAAIQNNREKVFDVVLELLGGFDSFSPMERYQLMRALSNAAKFGHIEITKKILAVIKSPSLLSAGERTEIDSLVRFAGREGCFELLACLLKFGCGLTDLPSFGIATDKYAALDALLPEDQRGVLALRDWLVSKLNDKQVSRRWFPGSMLAQPYEGNNGQDGAAIGDILLALPQCFSSLVGFSLRPAYVKSRDMAALILFCVGSQGMMLPASVKLWKGQKFSRGDMKKVFDDYAAAFQRAFMMKVEDAELKTAIHSVARLMRAQNRFYARKDFDAEVFLALRMSRLALRALKN